MDSKRLIKLVEDGQLPEEWDIKEIQEPITGISSDFVFSLLPRVHENFKFKIMNLKDFLIKKTAGENTILFIHLEPNTGKFKSYIAYRNKTKAFHGLLLTSTYYFVHREGKLFLVKPTTVQDSAEKSTTLYLIRKWVQYDRCLHGEELEDALFALAHTPDSNRIQILPRTITT